MTSLLPRSTTASTRPSRESGTDAGHRRPLVLLATLGGVAAAASPLLVCLAVGVIGWFVTDAGAHGTPRDGLRVGALGWLMAHGSGIHVQGVAITAVPLGLTLLSAWAIWRIGHRVGDSVSGHGPDADRIADGERDWTVPVALAFYVVGYVATAIVTARLAGSPDTAPATGRVVLWSLVMCLALGGPAIAIGSGRAAIWASFLPLSLRAGASTALRILGTHLLASAAVFLVALALDLGSAANVLSQLHADVGDAILLVALMSVVVPNAVAFSGSYLLGPGFTVGAQTLVSPAVVVLGPLPMFPMLAALPDAGSSSWTPWLMALPPLVAAVAAARTQRRIPTLRWEEGALRGCVGGVVAGLLFAILAGLAGGAVGPGRMRDVGAPAFEVLVHALTAFGIGGLVGGLAMTWWQRRAARLSAAETA